MNKKNIRHYPTRTKVSGEGNPPLKGESIAFNLVEDPHRLAPQVGG